MRDYAPFLTQFSLSLISFNHFCPVVRAITYDGAIGFAAGGVGKAVQRRRAAIQAEVQKNLPKTVLGFDTSLANSSQQTYISHHLKDIRFLKRLPNGCIRVTLKGNRRGFIDTSGIFRDKHPGRFNSTLD